MTIDEAIDLIRGPKGTEVTLSIYREEWGETKDVKITRAVIDIPSLKLEIRDDAIAYLKLYHFSQKASYDFTEAAIEILNSNAQRMMITPAAASILNGHSPYPNMPRMKTFSSHLRGLYHLRRRE